MYFTYNGINTYGNTCSHIPPAWVGYSRMVKRVGSGFRLPEFSSWPHGQAIKSWESYLQSNHLCYGVYNSAYLKKMVVRI